MVQVWACPDDIKLTDDLLKIVLKAVSATLRAVHNFVQTPASTPRAHGYLFLQKPHSSNKYLIGFK